MESAVNGIADACSALGIPVVSGNVSLYNETEGVAVLPTPMIGMLGLLEDVEQRVGMAFREGQVIALLSGSERRAEGSGQEMLGASQYVETRVGLKVGMPPRVDLDAERAVQSACRAAIRRGIIEAAHDCSDGGLASAVAESCIAGRVGAAIALDELSRQHSETRNDVLLFAEEPSRIMVALPPEKWSALQQLAGEKGVALRWLGSSGGESLRITRGDSTLLDLPLSGIDAAWRGGLG
jgi:phosphoribosylformylglycinamidine synthase subunit PurL